MKLLWENINNFYIFWVSMKQHLVKPFTDRRLIWGLEFQTMLGARVMTDYEKYLGFPMIGGKLKVNTFRELHE